MAEQKFSRDHRLRKRREFLLVYEQGRKAHGRLVVVFGRRRAEGGPWRLGLTVTRKTAKKAVTRNKLRRRVREFFRRRENNPGGWDFVVNLKAAACQADFAELAQDLSQAMARLKLEQAQPMEGQGPS